MTWEAAIEHENCPRDGPDKQAGFESMNEAARWVAQEIVHHTSMWRTEMANISVIIKRACPHDKQASWVKAAREFLDKTGELKYTDLDRDTWPAYDRVSGLLKFLATCAKCGEAVA